MIVRKAIEKDLEKIVAYAYQLVQQHQAFNPKRFAKLQNHVEQMRKFLKKQVNHPKSLLLVLEKEGEVIGYTLTKLEGSSLLEIASDSVWIHDIFIDKTVRSISAGKLLLQKTIEEAQALGPKKIMLHVAFQNEWAKQFFEKAGFEVALYEMMLTLK